MINKKVILATGATGIIVKTINENILVKLTGQIGPMPYKIQDIEKIECDICTIMCFKNEFSKSDFEVCDHCRMEQMQKIASAMKKAS
jgi:hypothetical protein